jgi:hypothetical protein
MRFSQPQHVDGRVSLIEVARMLSVLSRPVRHEENTSIYYDRSEYLCRQIVLKE